VSLSLPPLELLLNGLPPSSTKASVSSRIDGRPLCWSNHTIRLGIAGGLQKGGEQLPFFKGKKKKKARLFRMGVCLSTESGADLEQKKKSQMIDRKIEEDSRRLRRECKILLLGMFSL
jgi:hypothetical protein